MREIHIPLPDKDVRWDRAEEWHREKRQKTSKEQSEKCSAIWEKYKIAVVFVMIIAACSTVFSVVGPKVLGKATTALASGLMAKVAGTGGIDFNLYRKNPAFCAWFNTCSALS